ncbi:MAG TPA: hypothetical protein VHZ09_11780 [Acidobacteriaceae bacterium]|jgi:hypothetical protein|nr:hypothetical protein [Acidobacteriaceae bacterium]
MNQYIFLRRMRGPIMLLVFGVTAILAEYTRIGYADSWPLYIIAWGVLKLAENAILAQHPPSSMPPYPGYQQPAYPAADYQQHGYAPYPGAGAATGSTTGTTISTPIVPVDDEERR